jgi:IS30 family transposase
VTDREAERIWKLRSEGFSFTHIAKQLYMRVNTVFYSYRKLLERGGYHIDGRMLNGQKSKTFKITKELKKVLLSHSLLQKWSGFTISQRLKLIEVDHNVVLGHTTLKDFYKKHGVKYLQVSYMYY